MNIITLAMTLLKHRDSVAKIVAVLPELKNIFSALAPDQPEPAQPPPSPAGHPVGSMSWLQESLNILNNAGLDVDGEYGPATNKAVADYQRAHGLEADGWAGPETVNSIIGELAA